MKNCFFILLLSFFFINCRNSVYEEIAIVNESEQEKDTLQNEEGPTIITDTIIVPDEYDRIVLGDIDFDNLIDTAIVHTPAFYSIIDKPLDYFYKTVNGSYDNSVKFSNGLTDLIIENSLWADIKQVDDINNDGVCEILVLKNWYNGCWNGLVLYSYFKNQWNKIKHSSIYACSEGDFSKRIIKKGKKYYFVGTKTVEGDNFDDEIEIKMSDFN